jgi:hypothetical protein
MKLDEQKAARAEMEKEAEFVEADSDDALSTSNGAASESAMSIPMASRTRELESELRIAKEGRLLGH